jgi:hypothetical protein
MASSFFLLLTRFNKARRIDDVSRGSLSGYEISRVVYRVGIFRSVSVGISRYLPYRYQRKTRSVYSVSKLWREPVKKMAGAPFFLRRGGLGPLFVHFALLLKKKRNSCGIFQKKSSRKILKRCSRQILQYNNTDRKYQKSSKSDTSKIPISKKLLVTPWYTTLEIR